MGPEQEGPSLPCSLCDSGEGGSRGRVLHKGRTRLLHILAELVCLLYADYIVV